MESEEEQRGLWEAVVALYAEPGVAEACIAAQDEAGADVLLLLAAVHKARCGESLVERGRDLAAAAEPWRSAVVRPLRALRTGWREVEHSESLRQRLKALELEAERMQLERLVPQLSGTRAQPGQSLLRSNLKAVEPTLSEEYLAKLLTVFGGK